MKRLFPFLLLAAMLLTGCGGEPMPTTAPPATAAPDPLPTATPAPTPAGPNDAYFDNSLFIGDSILEGVRLYVARERQDGAVLGEARFLTTTIGISLADLAEDRQIGVGYSYKGQELPLADIVRDMAPRRVFLLLGLNDLAGEQPDVALAMDRYGRLIDSLRDTLPGCEVIVLTNPPKIFSYWLPDYTPNRNFNNALIDDFVLALEGLCAARNVPTVDVHGALSDADGNLPQNYCSDGYVHLSEAGAARLVETLYAFAEGRN